MSRGGELLTRLTGVVSVRRVFGAPIEHGDVTVIPVAAVAGGGGGGSGPQAGDEAGGGFGMSGRPVGVYVIQGDTVTWQPAVDVTKLVFTGQLVALAVVLVVRRVVLTRSKRRRR